jgi:hypothetical protein
MAIYSLALCLDINMRTVITTRNDAAQRRFSYQVDYAAIPLPAELVVTLNAMRDEYGELFGFDEDRHPTVEQEAAFRERLVALVPQIEAAAGPDYSIEVD